MNYFIIITRKLFTLLLVLSATFQLLASPVALAYENAVENATVIIVVAQSISEDKERNKAFQNGKVLKAALKKRSIVFTCSEDYLYYANTEDKKLHAWALTMQAECDAVSNKFDIALGHLQDAKQIYEWNLESKYLLLQINFEKENYDDFVTSFNDLIDRVTNDKWPTFMSSNEVDPHFVIQELRQRITPNLFALINTAFKSNDRSLDLKILEIIKHIKTKPGGCNTILTNILGKLDNYNVLIHSTYNKRAIDPKSLEIYVRFSTGIQKIMCPELKKIVTSINKRKG